MALVRVQYHLAALNAAVQKLGDTDNGKADSVCVLLTTITLRLVLQAQLWLP